MSSLLTTEKPEEPEEDEEDPDDDYYIDEDAMLEVLKEEIGVLPEVGKNIAISMFLIISITAISIAVLAVIRFRKG